MPRVALAILVLAAALAMVPSASAGDGDTDPRILEPRDGAVVPHRFVVRFAPAHQGHDHDATMRHMHLHLLIDVPLPQPGDPVPMDEHHLHFMNGEMRATLDLPAGRHTLQLLAADGNHMPAHDPIVSRKITVMIQ